jgi:hypothetical protein
LVTDTNIWIDLEHGGLLALVFELPYQFLVPDFAIAKLFQPSWERLQSHGVLAQSLTPNLVQELVRLRSTYRALSVTDLAAFLTAQALDTILLTGDRHLAALANQAGLTVHGMLWVLDELLYWQCLQPPQAAQALRQILTGSARLPARECRRRLQAWTT